MNKIVLVFTFFILKQCVFSQTFIGSFNSLDISSVRTGIILKSTFDNINVSIYGNKSINNGTLVGGIGVGYYFVNLETHKVGVNILYDGFVNLPALNTTHQIHKRLYLDVNYVPHLRYLFQIQTSLVYNL